MFANRKGKHAGYTILQIAPAQVSMPRFVVQPVQVAFTSGDLPGYTDKTHGQQVYGYKATPVFKDTPHLIGYEGECVHCYHSASISWTDIISVLLELCPSQLLVGTNLSRLRSYSSYSKVITKAWQAPPSYYNIGKFRFYVSKSYGQNGQTYNFSMHSTGSSYQVYSTNSRGAKDAANATCAITGYESTGYSYEWTLDRYCDQKYYKSTTWPAHYWHKSGDQYYHHESGEGTGSYRNSLFIKVDNDLIWNAYNAIRSSLDQQMPKLDPLKIPLMPVEESFLDDLYEVFDRPSYNLVASIIEAAGGVKNAKNLAGLFKSIKRSGGIKQQLLKEGSHLLKDKKLKTASDLYLTKKYVYETSRMDIDDFFKKLSSRLSRLANPTQHFQYLYMDAENERCVKHCIRIAYHNPQQSWAKLNGLDLPLEAVWDVIPWSFVVDWFCTFGDSLESIEKTEAVMNEIDVICCTESVKQTKQQTVDVEVSGVSFPIAVQSIAYNRQVTDGLPPVYPRSPELSNPFNHIIDGAALVFAR